MPRPQREGWIDWRTSEARQVVLDDLVDGILSVEEDEVSAVEAWNMVYKHLVEFRDVVFSQFEARLADHRSQIKHKTGHIDRQVAALQHDRQIHPPRTIDRRGFRVFYLSAAYPKLVEDVRNEKNLTLTTAQLFYSRPEYFQDWKFEDFEPRVRQESARQKFLYHCEVKQAQKEAKKSKRRDQSRRR